MGRRMMRALGAGLMEAGNQAQLLRKEQLELKRQQNLREIAEGRQGLMREQNETMKTHYEGLATERGEKRKVDALSTIQDRFDALEMMSPDNQERKQYYETRMSIMDKFKDDNIDSEEMNTALAELRGKYAETRMANFTGTPEERAAYKSQLDEHVKTVESFFTTAQNNMKLAAPEWDGNVRDFLFMSKETRDEVDPALEEMQVTGERGAMTPPPEEPSFLDKVTPDVGGLMGSIGSAWNQGSTPEMVAKGREYAGTTGGHTLNPAPATEFPTERLDQGGLMGRGQGADPMADYRRLKFDEQGNVVIPGT